MWKCWENQSSPFICTWACIRTLKLLCQTAQIYLSEYMHPPESYNSYMTTNVNYLLFQNMHWSLYLLYFNKRSNQSHSVSTIANDMSRDWCWEVEQMVNLSCEIPFSGYCTAEIEIICMILYMRIDFTYTMMRALCQSLVTFDKVLIV